MLELAAANALNRAAMWIGINRVLGALFFGGGLWASAISAYYVLQDWRTLNAFYARFEALVASNAPLRSLYIVGTEQAAFRLNCFADGVGVLLGAIVAALGWLILTRELGRAR